VSFLFGNISQIGTPGIFYYGLFIFLFIYALTELMDRNPFAFVWEGIKIGLGFCFLKPGNEWLGQKTLHPMVFSMVGGYLILSLIISVYFSFLHKKEDTLKLTIK
jgi:hypothetical protein